jgi:hypothetical protein
VRCDGNNLPEVQESVLHTARDGGGHNWMDKSVPLVFLSSSASHHSPTSFCPRKGWHSHRTLQAWEKNSKSCKNIGNCKWKKVSQTRAPNMQDTHLLLLNHLAKAMQTCHELPQNSEEHLRTWENENQTQV